jgi:hypothetical protein
MTTKSLAVGCAAAAWVLLEAGSLPAAQVTSTYTAGGSGAWENPASWSNSNGSLAYPDNNNGSGDSYISRHLLNGVEIQLNSVVQVDELILFNSNGGLTLGGAARLTAEYAHLTTAGSTLSAPVITLNTGAQMHVPGALHSQGEVNVAAGATLSGGSFHSDTLRVSSIAGAMDLSGEFSIAGGGIGITGQLSSRSVSLGAFAVLTVPGTVQAQTFLHGGLLDLLGGTVTTNSAIEVAGGGSIRGWGTISGAHVTEGVISPGTFDATGHLQIADELSFRDNASTSLNIRIADNPASLDFDRVTAGGIAQLETALWVQFMGSFIASSADEYTILTATQIDMDHLVVEGGGGRVTVYNEDGEAGSFAYEVRAPAAGLEQLVLHDFVAIPEPTYAGVAAGLAVLLHRRRRR